MIRRAGLGVTAHGENVVDTASGSCRITKPTSRLSQSGVGVVTADITEVGLTELLHLPQLQVRVEQVGPGRQGGPGLVVIGISLIGLALWGWAEDTLGWSVFALTALGATLTMTGLGLAARTQLDRQRTDATLSSRPAARVVARSGAGTGDSSQTPLMLCRLNWMNCLERPTRDTDWRRHCCIEP
jgi:hypothetical protein